MSKSVLLSCALLCLFVPVVTLAQAVTGTGVGTVTDATGAVVPNAKIALLEVNTNLGRSNATNESGNYSFVNVPPGMYTVTVEHTGFRKASRESVEVTVNSTVRVDMQLQTAARQPLRVLQLQRLHAVGNGQARLANNIQFGGVNDNHRTGLLTVYVPPAEAIQTVDVTTSNYEAELGRAGGAVMNVALKSGTNEIHGSLYEFNRVSKAGRYSTLTAVDRSILELMATGKELVALARKHVGESYVLGALAPKDNAGHKGPWDCAEFASWLVFQVSAQLYGCADNTARPAIADAFTGFWARDAAALGRKVSVDDAAATAGAMVLRAPGSAGIKIGHIAVSDGAGGTVEAHSAKRGVIASTLSGRVWDTGVLVPWMVYSPGSPVPLAPPSATVLRLTDPPTRGPEVREIQRLLKAAGFGPGPLDGVYGEQTVAAVRAFQIAKGLLPDGEAGPVTRKALERAAG